MVFAGKRRLLHQLGLIWLVQQESWWNDHWIQFKQIDQNLAIESVDHRWKRIVCQTDWQPKRQVRTQAADWRLISMCFILIFFIRYYCCNGECYEFEYRGKRGSRKRTPNQLPRSRKNVFLCERKRKLFISLLFPSKNGNFALNAFFMERLVNQNTYQTKQAKYRGMTPIIINTDGTLTRRNL